MTRIEGHAKLHDLSAFVALVTGGAAGIGLATARLLGAHGATLSQRVRYASEHSHTCHAPLTR